MQKVGYYVTVIVVWWHSLQCVHWMLVYRLTILLNCLPGWVYVKSWGLYLDQLLNPCLCWIYPDKKKISFYDHCVYSYVHCKPMYIYLIKVIPNVIRIYGLYVYAVKYCGIIVRRKDALYIINCEQTIQQYNIIMIIIFDWYFCGCMFAFMYFNLKKIFSIKYGYFSLWLCLLLPQFAVLGCLWIRRLRLIRKRICLELCMWYLSQWYHLNSLSTTDLDALYMIASRASIIHWLLVLVTVIHASRNQLPFWSCEKGSISSLYTSRLRVRRRSCVLDVFFSLNPTYS